ncbi:glycosyltransferase family 2 protein [Xaviernesmea oryzae]|nr:glycosyltransferase [Xaviernesmea oryzae]SEK90493.1 Glycosyl transferase family 2 [Xaviernesmea oryzae]
MPLFSVVIPLYNRRSVIAATIDSVLQQTFQDFEIVIIDDGSKDQPEDVINAIKDPRIRLIRQPNAGGSAARNHGIDEARGEFIAFLDSDDEFLPDHLSAAKTALDQAPGKNTVVYSPVIVDRGGGKTFIKPPRAIRPDEEMADYVMSDRGFVQTSGLIVPTEIARKVKYRLGMPFGQDTDFAIRLFAAGCQFKMTERPTVVWNDIADPGRVSASRKGNRVMGWLEEMKPFISRRAYLGYRGWHVAKGLAPTNPLLAIKYYFIALTSGCYSPKLALAVFLQIVMPESLYRQFSDFVIDRARQLT